MTIHDDRQRRKLKKDHRDVRKRYDEALERIETLETDLEAATSLHEKVHHIKIHPVHSKGTAEATAVVLLSDWHCEERVNPAQVNGLNKYNMRSAAKRAEECFQKILRLVRKEQQDVKIDTLLLWLGGDFITNSLREENLENNEVPPIEAALFAKGLLGAGLTFLQNNSKLKIKCVCSSGNHARITKKIHASTEHGNSLETFIYCSLRREHPEIEWDIDPGYNTMVKVYGFNLRFNHGHFVKYAGGIGGLTIPLIKAINGWDTQVPANMTFIGHWHQFFSHRRFVVNGSMIGFNPFAVAIKAEYEPPSQTIFLIDKRRGRTVTMPILFNN